jgi:hypothetical protein
VQSYLAHSILATVFCCLPFGIVGIVFAAQVGAKLAAGDYAGAVHASKQAKMWCLVAVGGFVLMLIGYAVLMAIGVGVGALNSHSLQVRPQ